MSDDHATVVEEYCDLLKSHLEKARRMDTDLPEIEKSEATKQRLKDLGYVE